MTDRIDRRTFLRSSAVAAALGASASTSAAEPDDSDSPTTHREPARDVDIVEHADVVVCGAGPAGVSAAIAAARAGAKTRLIEVAGCLGGIWTAGLLSWILDSDNKSGLMPEIIERVKARNAYNRFGGSVGYDPEQMKLVLEQMCREAGVAVRLHTRVVSAVCDPSKRLRLVLTESKSGREAFSGDIFVDATGDGDLAAAAGCEFDLGRGPNHECQPMSMFAMVTGIDPEGVWPYVRGLAEPRGEMNPKIRLRDAIRRGGHDPSYGVPVLFYIRPGLFCLGVNHEFGVSALDAQQITDATLSARAETHRAVDGLRSLGDPWKDLMIVATSEQIGVREGRRIKGLYEVTQEDLIQGTRHEDAVCRVKFPIDVHSPNPDKSKAIESHFRSKPYDVPYRALIARDAGGLLLAGRNISGDFLAHSSYRVTGDSVPMGEAAGTAAALAAASGRLPQDVPWTEIARQLNWEPKAEPPA